MNASGGSFKQQASASDVRAGAQEDLDKISMSGSQAGKKKTSAPRTLKPIASSGQMTTSSKLGAPSKASSKTY